MISPARRKAAAFLLLSLASAAGAVAWRPHRRLADSHPRVDLETLFPRQFGDWRVDERVPVQLVSPDTKALLDKIYNQTLARTYVNGRGERIMLSVAYGGDQSDATRAHLPEVCYPAQGFQILSSRKATLELGSRSLRVRRLVSQQGARVEPITYWIMVGERVALSGTDQKLAQLSYSTRGVIPDGMLVRVSSIDSDAAHAFGLQQQFVGDLDKAIAADRRPLVLGRASG
ncbi:MAG: EpsI family protein [Comamonadaceae bacterium]|jgi:EpsI family protein|nr:EpsI family protein [Comamonadaceae bacterium]